MKIKNISCSQFAGIRERNVSLTDGINIIYGKNESGKSTVVNLISRTLFQNAKLDRRKDKTFFDLYFPSAKKGGTAVGDFVDGKITLEAEGIEYSLSKEWGTEPRCSFSTPDGIIRDGAAIDTMLREVLVYGEGVYSDMLLSSQRNADSVLCNLLDFSNRGDSKQELIDVVSQAFAESDGVSVDAIEQAIAAEIEALAGKHWDIERGVPLRKAGGGRHLKQTGKVLDAYYALEDAREILDNVSELENDADRAAGEYAFKDAAFRKAEEAYNRFNNFSSRLAVQNERKKRINSINNELMRISAVLSEWPGLSDALSRARTLETEKRNCSIYDLWNAVNAVRSELNDEDYAASGLPYPDRAEVAAVKKAQREIALIDAKLCGMNLNAAINMLGTDTVEITSLRTGERVDVTDGVAAVTEAVKITVPGVIELQLSPADVDVAACERAVSEHKSVIAEIFARYKVASLEELENYIQKIDTARAKIQNAETRISRALGSLTMTELDELHSKAEPVSRTMAEIDRDIISVCGRTDISVFITKTATIIEGYAAEHGSINDLKAKAFDLNAELEKAKASVIGTEDIPEEYLGIADPEAYLDSLQTDLRLCQNLRELALGEKTAAAGKLEAYKENADSDPVADVQKAERSFNQHKELLGHWLNIQRAFEVQKAKLNNNPMQLLADRFSHYLGVISDGRVSTEFPEADKLNMNIYSADRLLDFGKLSEGTKETVSLAFRLAVLDHLFPEGGGVIVFDDPFTDMDAERTAQACALLKVCAEKHQVIFLTCKEEYLSLLEGNKIMF